MFPSQLTKMSSYADCRKFKISKIMYKDSLPDVNDFGVFV